MQSTEEAQTQITTTLSHSNNKRRFSRRSDNKRKDEDTREQVATAGSEGVKSG